MLILSNLFIKISLKKLNSNCSNNVISEIYVIYYVWNLVVFGKTRMFPFSVNN